MEGYLPPETNFLDYALPEGAIRTLTFAFVSEGKLLFFCHTAVTSGLNRYGGEARCGEVRVEIEGQC